MKREDYNNLIQNVVELELKIFPELRYIQVLWNLDIIDYVNGSQCFIDDKYCSIIDRYYEEPYDTVVRILHKIVKLINGYFPEDATTAMKLLKDNIITTLEKLNLVHKTDNYKICIN